MYFRATDNNTFKNIFTELSKLQKNDIEVNVKKEFKPYYEPFMISLIILLGLFSGLVLWKREV
jgi:hypothetical protein